MSELLYKTLRESVVNAIRAKIMNHQIRPGERIVELELAQEFHTSRGPIREALRQLEIEGIVEYTRNVGCSVRNFSVKDSYEVYLLRTNYEIVSIRLLNGKVPEDTIRNMENILEHMKSIPVNEFDRVFEYDNQFHEQLVLMSKLPRLEKAWKELEKVEGLELVGSLKYNIEVNAAGVNKGTGLVNLGKLLGISREEIMACGDGDNDTVMLREVGLGVAMANAEDQVKEVADYITLSNDEDGVAKAIEKFALEGGEKC